MNTQNEDKVISTRTLYRELPRIVRAVAKGARFAVTKNGVPMLSVGPVLTARGARYTLKSFRVLQFKGGAKNLSKRVDEIVYGA